MSLNERFWSWKGYILTQYKIKISKGQKPLHLTLYFFSTFLHFYRSRGKKELRKAWKKITFSLQNTGKTVTYSSYK